MAIAKSGAEAATIGARKTRPWSEWQREEMISLQTAAMLMPHGPSLRTAYTYARYGVKSQITGIVEKLESFSVPGRQLMTSKEAVERFLDRLNGEGVELKELQEAST